MSPSYLLPTRVKCHDGYRGDERPRAVWIEERRLEINEIVDRWYQASEDPTLPSAAYFRVHAAGGEAFLLRHDLSSRSWFLVVTAGRD